MYVCLSVTLLYASEGSGVVACTCMKAEAGGWMLAEPRLLSRARLREARRRRTQHAEGHKTTATSKEKEVKLKHRVLVSTPDQRTGPFRINVLILTQCYLLRARGISAHFAYTSIYTCGKIISMK